MPARVGFRNEVFLRGCVPADFECAGALVLGFDWSLKQWWPKTLSQIVQAVQHRVQVIVVVPDNSAQFIVTDALLDAGVSLQNVQFTSSPINSIWIRDLGPTVIRLLSGEWKWVDAFYGAGARRSFDGQIPSTLARTFGIPAAVVPICLENGNLLTNGRGLVICTTEILQKNLGCGYNEAHVTRILRRMFNATDVIFLESLQGEPNGHVDWFATFTSHDTVVVADYGGSDQIDARILDRNAERLSSLYTETGRLKVVRMPMPPRRSELVAGTYTNVLFASGVLLVPTWPGTDRRIEAQVFATYRDLLPEWEVVGIDASMLGKQGGALRTVGARLHQLSTPFFEIACDHRGAVPA